MSSRSRLTCLEAGLGWGDAAHIGLLIRAYKLPVGWYTGISQAAVSDYTTLPLPYDASSGHMTLQNGHVRWAPPPRSDSLDLFQSLSDLWPLASGLWKLTVEQDVDKLMGQTG